MRLLNYDILKNINNVNDLRKKIENFDFYGLNKDKKTEVSKIFKTYLSNNYLEHDYTFFENYLKNDFKEFNKTNGLNYGSWLGISALILSLFTNGIIYCCDFQDKILINNILNQISSKNKKNISYSLVKDFNISEELDWIVIYNFFDNHKTEDINIYNDLKKKVKYFRDILKDNGVLLITDFEKTSKIKLKQLIKILSEYFMRYTVYYNEDNCRFVIKCFRNNVNNVILNFNSMSYTGTTFISKKIGNCIDAHCFFAYFSNDIKVNAECLNCQDNCKLKKGYELKDYIKTSHSVLNNCPSSKLKINNQIISVYISKFIYPLITSYGRYFNSTIEESILFWRKAFSNNLIKFSYHIKYEDFIENYQKVLKDFASKFKIKYNYNFNKKRCHILNSGNSSEMLSNYYKTNKIVNTLQDIQLKNNNNKSKYLRYEKKFYYETKNILNIDDDYKNKLSLNDFNYIYKSFLNDSKINKEYYKLNIFDSPQKVFESYYLFKPIKCSFVKTNNYNKNLKIYSVIIQETEELCNHYIERKFYNIKENENFDFEFYIKYNNNYGFLINEIDCNGRTKSFPIKNNNISDYKDGFKKIKFSCSTGNGNNDYTLKIILTYKNNTLYKGDKNRCIEIYINI